MPLKCLTWNDNTSHDHAVASASQDISGEGQVQAEQQAGCQEEEGMAKSDGTFSKSLLQKGDVDDASDVKNAHETCNSLF